MVPGRGKGQVCGLKALAQLQQHNCSKRAAKLKSEWNGEKVLSHRSFQSADGFESIWGSGTRKSCKGLHEELTDLRSSLSCPPLSLVYITQWGLREKLENWSDPRNSLSHRMNWMSNNFVDFKESVPHLVWGRV